jgi:hypothetical protein
MDVLEALQHGCLALFANTTTYEEVCLEARRLMLAYHEALHRGGPDLCTINSHYVRMIPFMFFTLS